MRSAFIVAAAAVLLLGSQSEVRADETRERLPSAAVLQKALDARCLGRMEELADAEKDNATAITWEISPIAVRGIYTGFAAGTNYLCTLGTSQSTQPTGTIRYQEVTYEKAGKTLQAAESSDPRPIEINEITEIFVYRDGAWR